MRVPYALQVSPFPVVFAANRPPPPPRPAGSHVECTVHSSPAGASKQVCLQHIRSAHINCLLASRPLDLQEVCKHWPRRNLSTGSGHWLASLGRSSSKRCASTVHSSPARAFVYSTTCLPTSTACWPLDLQEVCKHWHRAAVRHLAARQAGPRVRPRVTHKLELPR